MEIYLIRHAEAVALSEVPADGDMTDADRPLTPRGESQSIALAKTLHKHGILLDKLISSPYLRAKQTAEILLREWSQADLVLELADELKPKVKPRRLSKFLLKQSGERIGFVGHMPMLGSIAGWLAGSKKAQIDIAKAGLVCLSCAGMPGKGRATIQWIVTPQWFPA